MPEGLNKGDGKKIEETEVILKNRDVISEFLNINKEIDPEKVEFYRKSYSGESSKFEYVRELSDTKMWFGYTSLSIEKGKYGRGSDVLKYIKMDMEERSEFKRKFRDAETFLRILQEINPEEAKKINEDANIIYKAIFPELDFS